MMAMHREWIKQKNWLIRCTTIDYLIRKRVIKKKDGEWFRKHYGVLGGNDDYLDCNEKLEELVKSKTPFCVIRPGLVEVDDYITWDKRRFILGRFFRHDDRISRYFSNFDDYADYESKTRELFKLVDVLIMFDFFKYIYLWKRYMNDKTIMGAHFFPPYFDKPWTLSLEGKSVLFISPFADQMKSQYARIDKVFGDKKIWPTMNASFMRALWYLPMIENGQIPNLTAAIELEYHEAMTYDFDIALISCGPASINLAMMIKAAGRQAIQIGGELQIYFGIAGKRWDSSPTITALYNDYWVRPDKKDESLTEEFRDSMDKACYW